MAVAVVGQHIKIKKLMAIFHRVAVLDFNSDKKPAPAHFFDYLRARSDINYAVLKYLTRLSGLLRQTLLFQDIKRRGSR